MQNGYKVMTKFKWLACLLALLISFSCFCACVSTNNGETSVNSLVSTFSSDSENDSSSFNNFSSSMNSSSLDDSSFSSSSSSSVQENVANVSIVESIFFDVETDVAQVIKGEDFTTVLYYLDGYTFDTCNYDNHTAVDLGDGSVALTLLDVKRNTRIEIKSKALPEEPYNLPMMNFYFTYEFNGGYLLKANGTPSGELNKTEVVSQNQHLRPNTWNAAGLERDGYTLIGWNTASDGSGMHIGLGSRITMEEGASMTLYAEWCAWVPEGYFSYRTNSAGTAVSITAYRGGYNGDPFVIPAKIKNKPVVEITAGFTNSSSIDVHTLVLPNTLQKIGSTAFGNANITEIYFSDNIEFIDDWAFNDTIETYHVNAYEDPAYMGVSTYFATFADSIDRLILNANKKKMVFFSGCSFSYGVQSKLIDEAYNGEYVICNLGINGDFYAGWQMECIIEYLGEGDVFVHAPEEGSPWQLMGNSPNDSQHDYLLLDHRLLMMAEGNYDLLAIPDFWGLDFFAAFQSFSELKDEMVAEKGYSDYTRGFTDCFDEYGDYIKEDRSYDESTEVERDKSFSDEGNWGYSFYHECLSEESVARFVYYYEQIEEKGVRVCFSYAPVNESTKTRDVRGDAAIFDAKLREYLAPYGYEPISDPNDYIYTGRYFFDSDYHLNDIGALLRTYQLIEDLKNAGI